MADAAAGADALSSWQIERLVWLKWEEFSFEGFERWSRRERGILRGGEWSAIIGAALSPSRFEERSTSLSFDFSPRLLSSIDAHTFWGRTRTSNEVLLFLLLLLLHHAARPHQHITGHNHRFQQRMRGTARNCEWGGRVVQARSPKWSEFLSVIASGPRLAGFFLLGTKHKWHANNNSREKLPDHYEHVKEKEVEWTFHFSLALGGIVGICYKE